MGAWIEIEEAKKAGWKSGVAPLVGAWIEIDLQESDFCIEIVAPLVGAWIEIVLPSTARGQVCVAPLVGAWIEIRRSSTTYELGESSLPSWERGLKLLSWCKCQTRSSRSPRGSVD